MNFGFVLREGFQGLSRNVTMMVALIITTAIAIVLVASGVIVHATARDTQDLYLERVEVLVQFNEDISKSDSDCSSAECKEVYDALEADPNVAGIVFRNREESYDRFVDLFREVDPQLVQETSPDALPAALHVRLVDPTDASAIDAIRELPQIDTIVDQSQEVRAATGNLDSMRNAAFLVAFLQALAAVFLIANMVQLAAFNRRTELSIMRMVGASRWVTQAPFVLEAVLAATIGALLAGAALFASKVLLLDPALHNLYQSQLLAPISSAQLWGTWPVVSIIGIVAAGLTAAVTLRYYVRT
ncbi:MAG: permease-like cell division protein FtsX [Corynebacterium sp.]|nr:permease-like cell division protein FtsX [Corynebacterium sp.]